MAIIINDLQPAFFGFFLNATSADLSGCEELKAAPGSGKRIILDTLVINTGATITVTIGAGETEGAVTSAIVGPLSCLENSTISLDFRHNGGLSLAADTALTVDASGAGAVCVFASGRVI